MRILRHTVLDTTRVVVYYRFYWARRIIGRKECGDEGSEFIIVQGRFGQGSWTGVDVRNWGFGY